MYPLYKNAYKRPFCSNIKALTRRKMKGFMNSLLLLSSSWKVVVQELLLLIKRKTTDTGTLRVGKLSSMTLNFINDRSRIKTLRDDGLTTSACALNAGFTLIELLVVVLIIGILAAAALPSYRVAVASSRVATMQVLVRAVDQAQQHFYMQTGRYAANLDGLIIAMPSGFTKTDEKHISSNDMYCYIMDVQGAWSVSFKCEDKKSNVWLEKYHNNSYTLCSAREDDSFGNRVCQNLSGKDERTGAWNDTSGGRSYYYFLGN